ncbi:MAG: hypothetical protein WD076_08580 [Parvularculaceae bacterium]
MQTMLHFFPHALALLMSVIFLDSLRYKFTNHRKTREIFGRLDGWAASFGAKGLFARAGLFSQYIVGAAELVASLCLLAGIIPGLEHLQAIGALIGLLVMAGAVSFHLFTPLGIDPNKDGGGLFTAACVNLIAAILLLAVFRREETVAFFCRLWNVVAPA